MAEVSGKKWSQIGILSYLKGQNPNLIVTKFKEQAKQLDNQKKHDIRQSILSSDKLYNTLSISGDTKVTLNHNSYEYEDELSAVILKNCKNYHQCHIKFIAEMVSREGRFQCQECYQECKSTQQVLLNAFVASYFEKIKNCEGSTLIFIKQSIGSQAMDEQRKSAVLSQEKTVIPKKDSKEGLIVQLKVLQIDCHDDKISHLETDKIAQNIEKVSKKTQSIQFQERELISSTNQILINLVCFESVVRIRNPLIHRLCKPQDHKNRLILYSYEHVYAKLYPKRNPQKKQRKKTVKCPFYPHCQNYFDDKNFQQMAVMLNNIRIPIYQEVRECVFGNYFSGYYQKNWHFNYAKNMLIKHQKSQALVNRYMDKILENVRDILLTANLTINKRKHFKYLQECQKNQSPFDDSIRFSIFEKETKIVVVSLGEFNMCPVRCVNCKNLNSLDAYKITYQFVSNSQKLCPVCKKKSQKKFYELFYIDLELMKFLFFQGHSKEILYNIQQKRYYHKLNFYTGRSLKQKLKQQNKIKKGYIYQSHMNTLEIEPELKKDVKYVPFMDRRCSQSIQFDNPQDYNKHIIYIDQNERLPENLQCPHCKRVVRSNELEYNMELETLLLGNSNRLRWEPKNQSDAFSSNMSIISLRYYNDIKNEFQIRQNRNLIKFYWKNYQGNLIKYPFKFRGCTHPLQTAICDFSDILYQSKVEKLTSFKCRYTQCSNQYSSAEEIERISIDIYAEIEKDQQTMRNIIKNNQYWILYNIQKGIIVKTSKKFDDRNDDKAEQMMIEKYRSKYIDSFQQKKDPKQILQRLKKINDLITYKTQQIKEDEEQSKKGLYKHTANQQQFQQLKASLKKLQETKKKLNELKLKSAKQQMDQNRKLNKTNNINFTKLAQMYRPQITKLQERKREEDPFQNAEPQDFSSLKTYGNLFPFKYPVPKTVLPWPNFLQQVEEAMYSQLNAREKKKPN